MEPIIQQILEHLSTLNEDYSILAANVGELKVDMAVIKSQMGQGVWFLKAIIGAFIVLGITQFWQVVIMRRNNKK